VPAVLALWAAARSPTAETVDTAEAVSALIAHDPGALLLFVADDDAVAGALIAGWDGWRGDMYRLAVLPAWRRRGVASALVEAGHARLRELGCSRVTALVGTSDPVAEALWRSAGYTADPAHERFVRNL
jgi:ribosomal protein S18 acetylase RimI-like enzyme